MLSGRRPRGNSKTPVSGKIGRMSGNTRSRSLMPPSPSRHASSKPASNKHASRKHQGGEAPPRAQGQRIGRPHDLEEFDELFPRRLVVPFAVALEERQQFVDRGLALG